MEMLPKFQLGLEETDLEKQILGRAAAVCSEGQVCVEMAGETAHRAFVWCTDQPPLRPPPPGTREQQGFYSSLNLLNTSQHPLYVQGCVCSLVPLVEI